MSLSAAQRDELEGRVRRLTLELEKSQADLKAAHSAKDRFLAHMSHEIRTPLNGVLGMLRVLQGMGLTIAQQRYAGAAERSGNTLMRLLNELIDISLDARAGAERAGLPFDLRDLLAELADSFAPLAAEKQLTLTLTHADALPRFVVGNELALRQVLNNLIHNAIKFTCVGGVALDVSGEYRLGSVVNVRISVTDTGRGMPEATRASLFSRQASRDADERAARGGGAGIGLELVGELVRQLQGSITMRSEPGEGSACTVELTLAVDSSVRDFSSIGADSTIPGVLLVGGESAEVHALAELLRFSRIWVDHAASADEAQLLVAKAQVLRPYAAVVGMTKAMGAVVPVGQASASDGSATMTVARLTRPSLDAHASHEGPSPEEAESLDEFAERILRAIASSDAGRAAEQPTQDPSNDRTDTPQCETGTDSRRIAGMALLVDDEAMNLSVLSELLRFEGIGSEVVSSGTVAAIRLRQTRYVAVFMDIRMPGMSGLTATELIRREERMSSHVRTPVIATTANVSDSDRELYLSRGIDDVLAKPIERSELARIVRRWINREELISPHAADAEQPDAELAELFLVSGRQRLDELAAASASGNLDQASLAAHTLKSMARHMGFAALGEVSQTIEHQTSPDAESPHINPVLVAKAEQLFGQARRVVTDRLSAVALR